jgi:predicted HicB family RNase H-like nuclease
VVDTYLADCKAPGRQPEKPYNGTIIILVDPEIHRRVAMKAAGNNFWLSQQKFDNSPEG